MRSIGRSVGAAGALALGGAARAACGDPSALLDRVEAAAFELRVDDATAALSDAEASFGCALVEPPELARFWDAEGALALLANDADAAARAFRAARRVGPGPNPNYGSRAKAASATAGEPDGRGSLDLSPRPAVFGVRVDGAAATVPLDVDAGDHLIQVVDGARVAFGALVRVSAGESFVLNASFVEPEAPVRVVPPPVPPEPAPERTRRSPALLIASGAMLAAGGLSAGLALREQNAVIPKAADERALDAAWTRQRAFGWSSYGLLGGAAIAAVTHVVW